MSDETTDPIAAIVREAMDYAADHGRITTPEDYADRIREALATLPAVEDVRERVVWLLSQWGDELEMHWEDPEDDVEPPGVGQIADEILALLRTPRGEGEAHRRRMPCGCVLCICDDDERCHGCGARKCGRPDSECDCRRALRSGSDSPPGEGEDEWEPMSMSMAGVAHPRLIPFRHRLSGVVAWVDQRAAARLRGEGGGE